MLCSDCPASADSRICPPIATDITRAAVALATPSTSIGLAPSATSAGAVLAQSDGPDMQTGTRLDRWNEQLQRLLVRQCIAHGVCHCVEQKQHAIGLVDLTPIPDGQQIPRGAVMRGPQSSHLGLADAHRQRGAVDDIGQEQGAQMAHQSTIGTMRITWRRSKCFSTVSMNACNSASARPWWSLRAAAYRQTFRRPHADSGRVAVEVLHQRHDRSLTLAALPTSRSRAGWHGVSTRRRTALGVRRSLRDEPAPRCFRRAKAQSVGHNGRGHTPDP